MYSQYKCPYEKSLETYLMILVQAKILAFLNVQEGYAGGIICNLGSVDAIFILEPGHVFSSKLKLPFRLGL